MNVVSILVPTLAAVLVAAAPLAAEETASDGSGGERTMEEVSEAYEAVKSYGFEKKDEAVTWFGEQLERLDGEIEGLRDDADEAGEEVVEDVRRQRDAAAEQLDRLRNATAELWEGVKDGTADAVEELDEAVAGASSDSDEDGER